MPNPINRRPANPKSRVVRYPELAELFRAAADNLRHYVDQRLEEMSVRLESNRRATLECILGQQRAEEEIRTLRTLVDAKAIIRAVRKMTTPAPATRAAPRKRKRGSP